jgi:formate/nitrite transporter FocA (FNT family)
MTVEDQHRNSENQDGDSAAELTETEKRVAEERSSLRAAVIHEAIRSEGEMELQRPTASLIWSGLGAGLSMGFSLIAMGLLYTRLPDSAWRPLVVDLGYTVGFLVVILGRQHLYTENTLTVMLPLLTRRDSETLTAMLRLWGVVLVSNVIGASLIAWVMCTTSIFKPEARSAFAAVAALTMQGGWFTVMLRGVVAGWIIATMVWMMPSSDNSRPIIIICMTYLVALGEFPHVVVSSVDGIFLVASGMLSLSTFSGHFLIPTAIGNTIGGVLLVAFFNHAQVVSDKELA